MVPVVADESKNLFQFKVFFLTLDSQVVQSKMDHIHPGNEDLKNKEKCHAKLGELGD